MYKSRKLRESSVYSVVRTVVLYKRKLSGAIPSVSAIAARSRPSVQRESQSIVRLAVSWPRGEYLTVSAHFVANTKSKMGLLSSVIVGLVVVVVVVVVVAAVEFVVVDVGVLL